VDRDPAFVGSLERTATAARIGDRLRITGPLGAAALQREQRGADLLVVPSRAETYGMVVTEALAAGTPVLAARVGGVPEALGETPDGVPGLLVPPEDAGALTGALTRWLTDAGLRDRLRRAARRRRAELPDWSATSRCVAAVLTAVRAEPDRPEFRRPQ
jgi:glycosyltransferase involved in cell wall biosynthesis